MNRASRVVAVVVLLLIGGQLRAGDREDLEAHPRSCKELRMWQEKCRMGACNVKQIERWRADCKRDSTRK
jgi:hypothetical protein